MISIGLVDDQQIVLAGLAAVIGAESNLKVAWTADSLSTAIASINDDVPDIVVCDIQLDEESGLGLLDAFPPGQPPVILLSAYDHPTYYATALERGAAGYIVKKALVSQLVNAIETVAAGGLAFPSHSLSARRGAIRAPSRRELEVVLEVVQGRSNEEVAARLGISAKTVDSHLRTLFDRYGVLSRTELAMRAVAEGWVRSVGSSTGPVAGGSWIADDQIVRTR